MRLLRELVDGPFKGNKTRAARAMKLTASFVHNVLEGHREPGLKLIEGLADVSGRTIADVLGEQAPTWAELEGWPEALAEARRRFGGASDAAWSWLASLAGPPPPGLDPTTLGLMAVAWDQAVPPSAAHVSPKTAA